MSAVVGLYVGSSRFYRAYTYRDLQEFENVRERCSQLREVRECSEELFRNGETPLHVSRINLLDSAGVECIPSRKTGIPSVSAMFN